MKNIQQRALWKRITASMCAMLMLLFVTTGCDEDEEEPREENEEELITTVKLTFTASGQTTRTFKWKKIDPAGREDPGVDSVKLVRDVAYTVTIEVLDESEGGEGDITSEIREEDEEHQFFFVDPDELFTYAYGDEDEDDNDVGLTGTLTTADDLKEGDFKVVLRHEPNKDARGVPTSDVDALSELSVVGGETDVAVEFPMKTLDP